MAIKIKRNKAKKFRVRPKSLFFMLILVCLLAAAGAAAASLGIKYLIESGAGRATESTISDYVYENREMLYVLPAAALLAAGASWLVAHIRERKLRKALLKSVEKMVSCDYSQLSSDGVDGQTAAFLGCLNTLSSRLASLNNENERLTQELNELNDRCRSAVFRSLSARVNSKMMNMVMASISSMAEDGRSSDIAMLTGDAVQVIDASLEDGASLVSLADELARIKRYLEVYEIIEQKKVRCRMSIMCNIVEYRVIPNLILPVVQAIFDNAVQPEDADYEMSIEVTASPSNLLVIIRDNSSNSSAELQPDDGNDSLLERELATKGLPVSLLNERIIAYYGEKYCIKFSPSALGNAIYVYLPAHSSAMA